ncbi:hypothetical protein [Mixta intestinalis]|uniref:Uncharacterized protein n=1 Tax=Mixta intestinalis TaxID=1615494 RepID=A0A6P1Q4W5_9GAMM|nr:MULTISPECIES: hypothetical protein [Mixta]QHM72978.1 hypothetical protein C7M51_03319 [Mixta intestinalis]QHM77675.1 hypothetical protein C7M52_03678 [Mixta theicola]
MFSEQSKQQLGQTGRSQFLAQRARLQASLKASRVNDTATRFNSLNETRKKVIFILANEAASRVAGLPQLTRRHLNLTYDDLSNAEKTCVMMGIKRLSEVAASIPWEFEDYVAPCAELQAARDKPPEPETAPN